ncbi:MAG: V-type ATPase subunit [Candidatus Omnitrophica bacterium]|nr:V-type ATPase subunit [Candidatus Omnitrophota bacterium]
MRQLATYAFTNAKVRAMLSYLLDPSTFAGLIDSKNIYDLIDQLKKTRYQNIFANVSPESLDLLALERKLLLNDISIYRKVHDSLSGKKEREFVSMLMQRYEIEDLKVILRLWYSKDPVNVQDYILSEKIKFDIDYKRIASAESIEEVIVLLDKTDYKEPLLLARDKFKSTKSLFYLEASLDIDYYNRLISCIGAFSATDKRVASKILAVEVDSENIQWLIKLRKYYGLNLGDMLEWFMPGGSMISKNMLRNLYTPDGITKVIESIALGPYLPIKKLADENIHLIESFLYEMLLKEVRKALGGNPFTIGTVFGYLILKRRETKNIISLLYAKACGLKKEELSRLINI